MQQHPDTSSILMPKISISMKKALRREGERAYDTKPNLLLKTFLYLRESPQSSVTPYNKKLNTISQPCHSISWKKKWRIIPSELKFFSSQWLNVLSSRHEKKGPNPTKVSQCWPNFYEMSYLSFLSVGNNDIEIILI